MRRSGILQLNLGPPGVLACVLAMAACSSGVGPGKGGGGGAAGEGGGIANPPQAGLKVNIRGADPSLTPPGTKCVVGGHSVFVGSPPPDAIKPGARVVDGEDGASISCTMRNNGGIFSIQGDISHKGVSFDITADVAPGGTGTGQIVHRNPILLEYVKNPDATPCTVSVEDPPLQVSDGKIWAKFACPGLVPEQQPTVHPTLFCEGEGFFVFDNCEQ